LKLLLDEMYSAAVAAGLRARGHDTVAVIERPELRARGDPDLFAVAQAERRALVTENIDDFQAIADGYDQRGTPHFVVVLVPAAKFPRGLRRTIGRMVKALDALAGEFPEDEATSRRHWL
jgi:predicted nuclease of predicted toxin-antitoxin system